MFVNALETQAYGQVASYLGDKISLSQLRRWFDEETWDIQGESDLLGQLELLFAEYTSRHRSEQDLKQQLADAIGSQFTLRPVISPLESLSLICTGSSNATKSPGFSPNPTTLGSSVGRLFVAAHG